MQQVQYIENFSIKVFLLFFKRRRYCQRRFFSLFHKKCERKRMSFYFETNVWEKFRKSFEEDIRDRAIFVTLYSTE